MDQGPGLGATMFAAVGKGGYTSSTSVQENSLPTRTDYNRIQRVKIYKNVYTQYKKVYPSTR